MSLSMRTLVALVDLAAAAGKKKLVLRVASEVQGHAATVYRHVTPSTRRYLDALGAPGRHRPDAEGTRP